MFLLDSEQKLRPHKHRLQRKLHSLLVWISALGRTVVQLEEAIDLRRFNRPPQRLRQEPLQNLSRRDAWPERPLTRLKTKQAIMHGPLFCRRLVLLLVDG